MMFLENVKSASATFVAILCSYEGTSARAYGIYETFIIDYSTQ